MESDRGRFAHPVCRSRLRSITTTYQGRSIGDESYPKSIYGSPATALGRVDGGSFTLLDGAMFVRFREVHLGVGRHPLEGQRPPTLLRKVSAVRSELLAQGHARPAGGPAVSQNMTTYRIQSVRTPPNTALEPTVAVAGRSHRARGPSTSSIQAADRDQHSL